MSDHHFHKRLRNSLSSYACVKPVKGEGTYAADISGALGDPETLRLIGGMIWRRMRLRSISTAVGVTDGGLLLTAATLLTPPSGAERSSGLHIGYDWNSDEPKLFGRRRNYDNRKALILPTAGMSDVCGDVSQIATYLSTESLGKVDLIVSVLHTGDDPAGFHKQLMDYLQKTTGHKALPYEYLICITDLPELPFCRDEKHDEKDANPDAATV